MAALTVIKEENLAENATKMGEIFRSRMRALQAKTNLVSAVRGKGLLNAIEITDNEDSETAWNMCMAFKENGLLAKPTHGNKIRFCATIGYYGAANE